MGHEFRAYKVWLPAVCTILTAGLLVARPSSEAIA
jgi:hypothetical protein